MAAYRFGGAIRIDQADLDAFIQSRPPTTTNPTDLESPPELEPDEHEPPEDPEQDEP